MTGLIRACWWARGGSAEQGVSLGASDAHREHVLSPCLPVLRLDGRLFVTEGSRVAGVRFVEAYGIFV